MSFSWSKDIGPPADLPFKEVLFETKTAASATAVDGSPVPHGEVWEINHVYLYVGDSGTLMLKKQIAGVNMIFERKDTATWLEWSGKILLEEGQKLAGSDSESTTLIMNVFGVKRLSLESAMASQRLRIDLILPKEVDIQEPDAVKDPPM